MKNFTVLLAALLILTGALGASDIPLTSMDVLAGNLTSSANNEILSSMAMPLQNLEQNIEQAIEETAREQALRVKMQKELKKHLTPEKMVPLFFREIAKLDPVTKKNKIHELQKAMMQTNAMSTKGGISGHVTVNGVPPTEPVTIYAFDRYGYFAGSNDVDEQTGEYSIAPLPSDSFFVVARSQSYVDEIFDDVKSSLGSWDSWRQAKKVFVPQAVVGGIDFDLDEGVHVTGTVTDDQGTPLETGTVVDIVVTADDSPIVVASASCEVVNGVYDFILPSTGRFKLQASSEGYESRWAGNVTSWSDASVLEISSLSDTPTQDFQLPAVSSLATGKISGTISPAILAISAAFDASDTSFVNMGLSLGLLFVPYTITDLPPGDYFVYADDYLGTLVGGGNYRGEFYDGGTGTPHVSEAAKITVVADQKVEGIDFTLDAGATIKGKVTNSQGVPLDSLSLLLVNADVLESASDPFLARFELHVVTTDFNGEYEIPGLRTGSYYLRTFSDFFVNFDLAHPDSILLDGKHSGAVIDEYYGGVQNLLAIADAEPLVIESETVIPGIDFQLADANFIVGTVMDATTSKPVANVTIVALQDTSGLPWLPLAEIDSLGEYKLGPLPRGNYKVAALTGFNGEVPYLSEFFNNSRNFFLADIVSLDSPRLDNINFDLERGATIQGFVDLQPGDGFYPAGGDTLDGMAVVAYETQTGRVASYDFVQFNGGWRINRLLPGSYKVQVVPQPSRYASTYLGRGNWFDDPLSSELTLNYGDVTTDQLIELESANGMIKGVITDSLYGAALSGVFVGAYDASGHLVGYALSDYDAVTGLRVSNDGSYTIKGLRDGDYYVRTVSLFRAVSLVDQVTEFVGMFENFDLLGFLLGGTFNNFNISFDTYKDNWYPAIPAGISIDLNALIYQASAYGLPSSNDNALVPVFLPLPFAEKVPAAAQMVTVTQGAAATVDFVLSEGALNDLTTGFTTASVTPESFNVNQNYPNPFNPSTTLSFTLPARQNVSIGIYDVMGRQLSLLANRPFDAGRHQVIWDGRDAAGKPVAAGLYFARIRAAGEDRTIKMLLVK